MTNRPQQKRPVGRKSLRTKIATGFAVVLLLHVSIAVMGHVGLDRAQSDLNEFQTGRLVTLHTVEIDRLVRELQSTVRNFTSTGHRSVETQFNEIYRNLIRELQEARGISKTEDAAVFESMESSLARYKHKFALAVVYRRERSDLVDFKLYQLGAATVAKLRAVRVRLSESGASIAADRVNGAEHQLAASLHSAQVYLNRLDSSYMGKADLQSKESLRLLESLPADLVSGDDSFAEVRRDIKAYAGSLVEILQTTRSYLHLIHVVMAGRAANLLRVSGDVRQRHLAELSALHDRIQREQKAFQFVSMIVSLITIIIGLIASRLISRVVANPLTAITSTFKRLARGDRAVKFPGHDREDEIGDLAQAAQVFHTKNVETADLLAETQRLARHSEAIIADLEARNTELDSFAHAASHDLKAPVRAMSALVSFLEEDCADRLGEDGAEHLNALKHRIARMSNLLEDLLSFARVGRDSFEASQVACLEVIEKVVSNCAIPPDFDVSIRGDDVTMSAYRVPLEMVLVNLVSNACKHHDRDRGRIEVDVRREGEVVRFVVTDDGPGIPAEFRERIFEPFESLKRRDEVEATGIGLALVKKLVDRFGVDIQCSATAGSRGARFTFSWPMRAIDASQSGSTSPDTSVLGERLIHA